MVIKSDFDGQVLNEHDFIVEFSNRGGLPKDDHCRYRNPEKRYIRCAVSGCLNKTKSRQGVCTEHMGDYKWQKHKRDWLARIIPPGGTREQYLTNAPGFGDLTEILIGWVNLDKKKQERLDGFFFDVMDIVPGGIPDSTSLQESFEKNGVDIMEPEEIVSMVQETVDKHFPPSEFMDVLVENYNIKIEQESIPLRMMAALLQLGYICEEANRGDRWYKTRIGKPQDIRNAGCFMSAGYYLYRRYTKATPKQTRMALRG